MELSLYCLKYGASVLSENMVFLGGSKEKVIPISFAIYFIQVGDRKILVDAGCDTMPGFEMKEFYSPAFVLRTMRLTADEITDVIITHAHHDHIEAIKHFRNAVVHITEEEYLNGKKYIPDNMPVNVFKDKYVIAPQITIIKWGGHSIGSSIVEIKMEDTIHILAGDECYTNGCIDRKIPTGCYYNLDKSRSFIKNYSNKKYRVHTCHDISLKTEKIL
jgi:glyoxylase-like metal-dependent hydrolase (beta-lactamase superfamily II)